LVVQARKTADGATEAEPTAGPSGVAPASSQMANSGPRPRHRGAADDDSPTADDLQLECLTDGSYTDSDDDSCIEVFFCFLTQPNLT